MRVLIRAVLVVLVMGFHPGSAGADEEIDFVLRIQTNSPQIAAEIGLQKLSDSERKHLNSLLNAVYRLGRDSVAPSGASADQKSSLPSSRIDSTGKAYVAKIESDEGKILKLSNGAVVEVTSGYLGYLGYRKQAVLFNSGSGCRIWIQEKKAFQCDVLKAPTSSLGGRAASLVTIAEVKARGEILVMADGAIYHVNSVDTITTSLWLGYADALLLDGIELVNLSEGGDIIGVSKIR